MYLKSPLRYPGGKQKAVNKILPYISLDFDEYREPLVGGGSIFLALKQIKPEAKYKISDLNYDLICFWKYMKNEPYELINKIRETKNNIKDGKELYLILKTYKSNDSFEKSVRFFILNRITYSGTIDSGGYSKESFEKRFTYSYIDRLKKIADSKILNDVEIFHKSYENLLNKKGKNVLIYLDPPYYNNKKSKLYGKNGDLHYNFNHDKFINDIKKIRHKWLITYDDCDKIRNSFNRSNIHSWVMQYGMNKYNKKGNELIITNYLPFKITPISSGKIDKIKIKNGRQRQARAGYFHR